MKNLLFALALAVPFAALAQEEAPEIAAPKSSAATPSTAEATGSRRPISQEQRAAALKVEEAKKKAEAEAKAKAEAEARARAPAEAEAKRKADEAAAAEAKAKSEAEAAAKKAEDEKRRQQALSAGGRRVLVPGAPPAPKEPAPVVDARFAPAEISEQAQVKVASYETAFAYSVIPENGCKEAKSFWLGTLLSPYDGLEAGAKIVLQAEAAAPKKLKGDAEVKAGGLRRAGKAEDGTYVYCGKVPRAVPYSPASGKLKPGKPAAK